MSCEICLLTPGEIYLIWSDDYAGCTVCSFNLNSFFPREAYYKGKVGGKHCFALIEPITCPDCGSIRRGGNSLCDNEGEMIELPLLMELPVKEEK